MTGLETLNNMSNMFLVGLVIILSIATVQVDFRSDASMFTVGIVHVAWFAVVIALLINL